MAKGHLIAAQYGRGDPARISATFTYTNTVPQFASFNSGKWRCSETKLITWGRNNCATSGNMDVRIFIVVGAIPSTYTRRMVQTPKYLFTKQWRKRVQGKRPKLHVDCSMLYVQISRRTGQLARWDQKHSIRQIQRPG